jgi:hypothetical protein
MPFKPGVVLVGVCLLALVASFQESGLVDALLLGGLLALLIALARVRTAVTGRRALRVADARASLLSKSRSS